MKLMKKLSYLQQEGELWNTNILVISQIDITDTQNFTHLEILEQKKTPNWILLCGSLLSLTLYESTKRNAKIVSLLKNCDQIPL